MSISATSTFANHGQARLISIAFHAVLIVLVLGFRARWPGASRRLPPTTQRSGQRLRWRSQGRTQYDPNTEYSPTVPYYGLRVRYDEASRPRIVRGAGAVDAYDVNVNVANRRELL